MGSNQRCMPPCSALYSTGCQWARCGDLRRARRRRTKQDGGGAGSGRRPSGSWSGGRSFHEAAALQLRFVHPASRTPTGRTQHGIACWRSKAASWSG
jgi:hypothetical protein